MVLSHFSTFLAVGPVVQVHVQLSCLDVSVDLPLPVMDQGGRTDDQSAVRNHESGVWMVNKQIIKKTWHSTSISPPEFRQNKVVLSKYSFTQTQKVSHQFWRASSPPSSPLPFFHLLFLPSSSWSVWEQSWSGFFPDPCRPLNPKSKTHKKKSHTVTISYLSFIFFTSPHCNFKNNKKKKGEHTEYSSTRILGFSPEQPGQSFLLVGEKRHLTNQSQLLE